MDISEDGLLAILRRELHTEPDKGDHSYVFAFGEDTEYTLSFSDLSDSVQKLRDYQVVDETSIANESTLEILVRPAESRVTAPLRMYLGDLPYCVVDTNQEIRYELGRPSFALAMYLVEEEARQDSRNSKYRLSRALRARQQMTRQSGASQRSIIEWFPKELPQYSLKIVSETKRRSTRALRRMGDAFLFQLAYNLDISIIPREWQGVPARPTSMRRTGRTGSSDLDAPRRVYLNDLVHHYLLGVSSPSPMLQYISFYHVAEHWFENVYQDDLVDEVQRRLTAPGFSFRRKKDIQELIKRINKAVQLRNEELIINEQVALKLTLVKYIDLPTLRADLDTLSPETPEHLANNKVKFSDGDLVHLHGENADDIISAISRRIYKTRNSIVHAKEGARGRFVPYTDDNVLIPEIPLIRLIAEQIIVATSEEQAY